VSDTPLYDETLSDLLLRARTEAQVRIAEAQTWAKREVEAAQQRADRVEQDYLAHRALLTEEINERVRATRVESNQEPETERTEHDAPPIPSMEELLQPSPGITRFLDSLLGAPER
jgi:vacuolar-type H+-ATPase subunit H